MPLPHYTKTDWLNDQSPDIDQDNLNHIETGIYDNREAIINLQNEGAGHTILDSSGTEMPRESKIQFSGATVTDDATNGKTVVTIPPGQPGAAATVTVGTTTTGEAGTNASVINSGTSSAAVLNFTIPRGAKGDTGAQGERGETGATGTPGADGITYTPVQGSTTTLTPSENAQVTLTVDDTNHTIRYDFAIPRGQTGSAGTGAGDMTKEVYDANDNGIVDNAERVSGYTVGRNVTADEYTNSQIDAMVANAGRVKTVNSVQPDASGNINVTTVNGHTVESNVPANAKFTDTVYDDTALSTAVSQNTANITSLSGNLSTVQGQIGSYIVGRDVLANEYTNAQIDSMVAEAGSVQTVDTFSPDSNGAVTTERILTQAQYDALSTAEKNNGMTYYISDGEGGGGAASLVVNITYANGEYSADKTYAEIMANINAGGQPIARYGAWYLRATTASATQIAFGDIAQTNGIGKFNISSSDAVTYSVTYVSPVRYYNKTLGSAEAVSDSTVYTNGYLLTLSNNYIDNFTSVRVLFPSEDYSGNVTWVTANDHTMSLYFDQNPNGKSIRIEWYSIVYTAVTIS